MELKIQHIQTFEFRAVDHLITTNESHTGDRNGM